MAYSPVGAYGFPMPLLPDTPEPAVPEIVGCDVELADGGGYLITHKRSGDTAIASTPEQAVIEGIALRVIASWKAEEIPFRTGDPT